MTQSAFELPPDLLAFLRSPPASAAERDTPDVFFDRPEIGRLYAQAQEPGQTEAVLSACAALLPEVHPNRASLLALMGGAQVEDGADPAILFPACHALLDVWLQELEPYCAEEVDEDDDEAEPEEVQAWADAQARMKAVPQERRWEVETLQQAVELLVLPMMAMVLRDERNHRAFLADDALQARIYRLNRNGSLPFEQLHYLWLAANMSYEDELVVVLPASGTGFVARAHAVNNGFHAFTLLQNLIREHGQALGVRQAIVDRAPPSEDNDSDTADFLWLQAPAYAGGELVNELAWSWGEAPLRANAQKHGKRVLIGLDKGDACSRSWAGFLGACHDAQNPHVAFKRYLTPEEVASYLQ